MEPALNILDRALHGDSGALSFLEKTASIYILDATNANAPTTYGCWDFLNQVLSEVERYEQQQYHHQNHQHHPLQHQSIGINLDSHVQLLCTMSRKAARRSPVSDRRLIGICLSNAAQHNINSAQALIDLNCQTRERVMGRIAAITFDFSFHRQPPQQHPNHLQFSSAFANPVAMEGLCAIIAANSISNGPKAVRDFVIDWIIPSISNLPPFAVSCIIYHLASESMGNAAPADTEEQLCQLSAPIITKVIGPLLIDALRESDVDETSTNSQWQQQYRTHDNASFTITRNQRLATISLRALERWCCSTSMTIRDLNQICKGTSVNIAEVISDTLYSHAEPIIDAAAELLDTLLRAGKPSNLKFDNDSMSADNNSENIDQETHAFLEELITAVGLQRFRFSERQGQGDTAVCRCLARIASSVALAAKSILRKNQLQGSYAGIVDLLLKSAAHPSVHVCGIALESLPSLIFTGHNLSDLLLPILQQKVVYPMHLVEMNDDHDMHMNNDGGSGDTDFQEFSQFREDCIAETLVECYLNNRIFYLESCARAMENFCVRSPPPTMASTYQLEGVLFCLKAVSINASKRALLVNSPSPAQALSSWKEGSTQNIAEDAARHNELLVRCVAALTAAPECPTSNPIVLSQMCQFVGKYANWFAKTPTPGVLDSGAELALRSFELSCSAFHDSPSSLNIMNQMQVSPFAEAATALRNILCRSPSHFATPQVLAALAGGWETSYLSANSDNRLSVDDREALCSGICRVLASLPPDQWVRSLSALSRPTIDSLEIVVKKADDLHAEKTFSINKQSLSTILKRGSDEIRLLSTMTRTFNNAQSSSLDTDRQSDDSAAADHPSLSLLRGSWPCLIYLAQKYSSHDIINEALGEFLISSLSFQEDGSCNLALLIELCDMVYTVLSVLSKLNDAAYLSPMLQFVEKAVECYGQQAEITIDRNKNIESISTNTTPNTERTRQVLESLLTKSIEAVSFGVDCLWAEGEGKDQEQHRGQNSIEGGSAEKSKAVRKKESLESIAALYNVFTTCIRRCPILLVCLGGSNNDESFFLRTINVAISTMGEKELDISRSSMIFLNTVIELRPALPDEQGHMKFNSHESDTVNSIIGGKIDDIISKVRQDLIHRLINGAMGNFRREALDSAANLLYSLLTRTIPSEARLILESSLQRDQFLLGDDALKITLSVLDECTNGKSLPPYLMNFFSDLWDLYQTDDAGGIAGGNVVKKFELKYSPARKTGT